MTLETTVTLPALLAELRDYAARSGDPALQARVQQLDAALAGASGSIKAGNITGSTAVGIGNNIRIFVK